MDANLVKIDKLVDLNNLKPVSFEGFSVSIIPATVSAFGFGLEKSGDNFSQIDWSMLLKFVNASDYSLIIENLKAEVLGKNGYISKSIFTEVYRANKESEIEIINILLDIPNNKTIYTKKEVVFLPFILKAQSENIIQVNFLLETYKKTFLKRLKPISFQRKDIKAPETYEDLFQKAVIQIKINKRSELILLKIP